MGDELRKWVSTSSIMINHVQTVSILALLKLHWPPSVEAATSFFSIDVSDWAASRPECLVQHVREVEELGGGCLSRLLSPHEPRSHEGTVTIRVAE